MKTRNSLAAVLWAILFFAGFAAAQTSSGMISGRVFDTSGSAVTHAGVILINQQTKEIRTAFTAASGDFAFTSVQPGAYTVSVHATGFKQFDKQNLLLTASERLSAGNLQLQLGSVNESVTVEAQPTPVQTTSAERSGLLNDKQMEMLMTRGRDFMSLLRVLPGVVGGEGGSSLGTTGTPTINGVRSEYNTATIDGVNGVTRGYGTLDTPLNLDAIAEVKVLEGNYQAEYGKSAGSVITVVTKSGGQQFHGTAYYYVRNEDFNANNFFNNRSGVARPQYRYNTFGYNVGGPIYWPGKFNSGKSKLFFFYSQEILPNRSPSGLKTYTVPTDLQRQGNFSQTVDLNGQLIPIHDPENNGQPFPGNIIRANRINPQTQKLLGIFPEPNFLNNAISKGNYNYITSYSEKTPVDQQILRADYDISSKWRTFFRGMNMSVDNNGYSSPANDLPWYIPVDYKTHNPNIAINAVYVATPTLVNELTVGTALWTEDQGVTPANLNKIERTNAGIALGQLYPRNNPLNLIPAMSFGGVPNAATTRFDGRFPMHDTVVSLTLTDGLTKVWNNHTFKFGVDLQGDQYDQAHHSGSASFTGSFDFGRNTQNPFDSNYAYSNALLGNFNSYSEGTARLDYRPRTTIVEWYAQDNWRVNRKLTLDYGVRFTWGLPQTLKVGANFVPALFNQANSPLLYSPGKNAKGQRVAVNPVTGEQFPAVYIGAFVPGSGNIDNGTITTTSNTPGYPSGSLLNGNGILAAPRLGFAYDPFGDGKTAIRGGFGILYNARARSGQEGDMTFNPPEIFNVSQYYGSAATFQNAGTVLFPSSVNHAIETNPNMLASYNLSLGVQRNIGWGTVVDVAYVGTLGRHLSGIQNINEVPYGAHFLASNIDPTTGKPLPDDFFRPYPGYGSIPFQQFDLTSSYHSLQAQINRRFAHGLQFGAVWTWSKAMDYTDSYNGTIATYVNPRVWDYGKAGFDRTHIVTVNWLWNIPRASRLWNIDPVKAVLDNWQISGIASFISGAPAGVSFSTVDGTDITGGGDGARVVLTANPVLSKDQRGLAQFFDTGVVARPAQGTIGDAPKDVFRGPGTNNWDLSLFKKIPIREKVTLQFRAEAYNAFNHTQWSGVNTSARFDAAGHQVNGLFGQVTSASDPRIMQLALRVSF
ncbi:MAG: carboxypeptidase regulatory-like domain-containing protein [Bryobacteraceae bacterium]